MYEDFKKKLMMIVMGILGLYVLSTFGVFQTDFYKGQGYKLIFPPGWVHDKERSQVIKDPETYNKTTIVTFVSPETDINLGGIPHASMSILSTKLDGAVWISDEWNTILGSLKQAGWVIGDQGEMMINNVISKWVIYHAPDRSVFNLEFFAVTDSALFVKLQYSAPPEYFNKYRPLFEAAKETFEFKFGF